MSKCYRKPYLKKVIAKIEFTSKIDVPTKGLNKKSSELILKQFPILEPREVVTRQVKISETGAKETRDTQNHLIFHGKNRKKTICISPDFAYLEISKYSTSDLLKKDFILLLNVLADETDYSIKRFGLRFINQIEIDESDPFSWDEYINSDLLAAFNIAEDKNKISRIFSNIIQNYNDNMMINFQYGMHNPDYPSIIKKKLYILDFDAFLQGVMEKELIQNQFDIAHTRIENLFEKSIKQKLRDLMEEVNE
ncbi:MAG: TIGR04255 family protein [Desulfosarcina sp.]|nr:TIGR04255 family protein [Desulfosarcina sp.]